MTTLSNNIISCNFLKVNELPSFNRDGLLDRLSLFGLYADVNEWADYWFYVFGVNVIPADSQNKTPLIAWKDFQDKPVPEEQYKEWRDQKKFDKGISIIAGKIWRGIYKEKYLACIDFDNKKGIDEFLTFFPTTKTLDELSSKTLVEQHVDNKEDKAHVYFIVEKPLTKKSGINTTSRTFGDHNTLLPAIEVKSEGGHGLMICTPSLHKMGCKYEIVGRIIPSVLNISQSEGLEDALDQIYKKYGHVGEKNNGEVLIADLFKENCRVTVGSRHKSLLRIIGSLLVRLKPVMTEDEIKEIAYRWNQHHCEPPLDDNEFRSIWVQQIKFVSKSAYPLDLDNHIRKSSSDIKEKPELIEIAAESILEKVHFITIEESQAILFYKDGVYVNGGEILIDKMAEAEFKYELSNYDLSEIKGHIKRKTYVSISDFDKDLSIINLKNGLYNWKKDELTPHHQSYYSTIQEPIWYDPNAKPKMFWTFLKQVLYPTDIRTVVEAMAYTFYRDCPFEYYFKLFGDGRNGKSVFTSLLTQLHGEKNVSNVSLSSLIDNRFALSDLEFKDINIDTELSGVMIKDTSLLKKLTGGRKQPNRIERKYKDACDTYIYAKLFFNTNAITNTPDQTDAYYRREIIISFPNKFEGENDDPYLIDKLSNKEELSAIFNILMKFLRIIIKNKRMYLNEKTIDERRLKHDRAVNPVKAFVDEAISENSTDVDYTIKADFYNAFKKYINNHSLASKSPEAVGKVLKSMGWQQSRITIGDERPNCWTGKKLKPEFVSTNRQQQVTEWISQA
ncbi:phage/plasmid primase, P4 family [Candidatus Nitrosocosmicus arcticus]|nr:phage/plasmid primase, P4 family [Candidatus Nitrosocosmicus arcticus]